MLAVLALTGCEPVDQGAPSATAPAAEAVATAADAAAAPPTSDTSAGTSAPSAAPAAPSSAAAAAPPTSAAPAAGAAGSSTGGFKKAAAAAAGAGAAYAVVSVIDGDTIRVSINGRREKVRLIGLDAPESKKPGVQVQCFAQKASSKMQSLVQSRSVRLAADPTQDDRDRYGRLLRHVFTLDGRSVAQELIRGGFAREYTYAAPYAGQAAYRAAQQQAQSSNAGLWGACGGFPAEVPFAAAPAPDPKPKASSTPTKKAAPRTPVKAVEPAKPQGSCDIKGNISDEGEKIYHVPGQQFYDKTKISPSKGERMFCSESDARNAGWRKAKV